MGPEQRSDNENRRGWPRQRARGNYPGSGAGKSPGPGFYAAVLGNSSVSALPAAAPSPQEPNARITL